MKKQIAKEYSGYDKEYEWQEKSHKKEYDQILKDLKNANILFHQYARPSYEGSVLTIYEKDGKYYHVEGGHCSCYGLEGQWMPLEMPFEGIIQFVESNYHFTEYNENFSEKEKLLKKLRKFNGNAKE